MDRRYIRSLEMASSRLEKSYGACNCDEKERTRCNRRPRGRTGRDMSVQVKRVFIMSITKISNRRLPQAETRSSTKGGLAPSWRACRSLAGVKTDVGAFNRRQHMEAATNAGEWGQGKCVLSHHGTENLELAILVAALCRRKSTEDSSEMVCKVGLGKGLVRAGEANRLVTSAAQRICMVAVTGVCAVRAAAGCWVLGAGA